MNIMLDTNIIIDYIAFRQPWYQDVEKIWQRIRSSADCAYVSASALTDIYYITSRIIDDAYAIKAVTLCSNTLEICTVDRAIVMHALALSGGDFEDAVVIACAEREHLDAIVTRNDKDFQHTSLAVYTPADYMQLHQGEDAGPNSR
ncbi:MAG: PIN domain-containing protein [Caldilineaceae bacterium]|nr:PIN domain-containing protein [Caldilineaceae bacterium]